MWSGPDAATSEKGHTPRTGRRMVSRARPAGCGTICVVPELTDTVLHLNSGAVIGVLDIA